MAHGYLLIVLLAPNEYLATEEKDRTITLPAPIGSVLVRGFPDGPLRQAQELTFTGEGFETEDAAREAGELLKDVLRLAFADISKGFDVGQDIQRSGLGKLLQDHYREQGVHLLKDVHGLQVYEETVGRPAVVRIRGEASIVTPFDSFVRALESRASEGGEGDRKRLLASDLFGQSRFEKSLRARHFLLVMALEVLADRRPRTGRVAELVQEFLGTVRVERRGAKDQGATDAELNDFNALVAQIERDLHDESIGSAIRRLAAQVEGTGIYVDTNFVDVTSRSYRARSELMHSGTTGEDLLSLLGPLEHAVLYLCTHPSEASL